MKKTLLASCIALTLGVAAPSAQAAFTPLAAGDYVMEITGGCFAFGDLWFSRFCGEIDL